jgi:hypothetical protein
VRAGWAAGVGSRGTARGCESEPNTGRAWGVEAAQPLRAVAPYCLPACHLSPGPLAALDAGVQAGKDGKGREAAASACRSRAPQGGWTARAPARQGWLTLEGGARPRAMAQGGGHQGVPGRAPAGGPRCVTDGFQESRTAWRTHEGRWGQPRRRPAPGAAPPPRWMPRPELLAAQVVQTRRRRRLVAGQPGGGGSGLRGLRLAPPSGLGGAAQSEPTAAGRGEREAPRAPL